MTSVYISPSKYIQGPKALDSLGEHGSKLGKKALCIISEGGHKRSGAQIAESFEKTETDIVFEYFNGESSKEEIDRLLEKLKETSSDLVIGVGGGKIFDTAKAVAYYAKKPVVIVPTIASTDAACSALSVLYTEEGVFSQYLFLPANPNLVLMDTEIIAKSPLRLSIAGMGDAIATYFEARACHMSGANTIAGGKVGLAALGIARLCFDTLMEEGLKAKIALEAGARTKAVERIIEANTLLSGIGFESGGLAGAHAIHNGLTALEEAHSMNHGEKVNFGTLCQLVLENIPEEELYPIMDWMIALGLPVTLEELGITNKTKEHLMPVAIAACDPQDTMGNMPFEVDADMIYNALLATDSLGHKMLGH